MNDYFDAFDKFRQVYDKYTGDGIIDLDRRLKARAAFEVYRLQDLLHHVGCRFPPVRQTAYSLLFIRAGQGEVCIDGKSVVVRDGMLAFIPSRTAHSTRYDIGCSGFLLHFNGDLLFHRFLSRESLVGRKLMRDRTWRYCQLRAEDQDLLTPLFESMLVIVQHGRTGVNELLPIKMLELLILCDPLFETEKRVDGGGLRNHPVVLRFEELLDHHFHLERGVQYYAERLGTHPNYLNALLKKYLGMGAKECIDRKLMTESRYLLVNPDLQIKEVAYRLGFNDPNSFSTFFQRREGNSPMGYRNSKLIHSASRV